MRDFLGRAQPPEDDLGQGLVFDLRRGIAHHVGLDQAGRDGANVGLIQVVDKAGEDFTDNDEAVLVQLAQLASTELQNLRLYQEQLALAETRPRA